MRSDANNSSAEDHLDEDVVIYKRDFELGLTSQTVACHDILRINLQRYLKRMDDPVKDMRFLDDKGQVTVLRTHRVYHFYLAIIGRASDQKLNKAAPESINTTKSLHRIVMDKGGVVRMEQV